MGQPRGTLHKLKIILDPTCNIAALENGGLIWIYYQGQCRDLFFIKDSRINDFGLDPGSGFIREVTQLGPLQEWKINNDAIARAVNGSSIAVVRCSDSNGIMHNRVYYQRPDLHLGESYLEASTVKWVSGEPVLELLVSLNQRSSHCRRFQAWNTTVWNTYNCRTRPLG
jgi:hypothetical protein